jgi:hypothetical protein
VNLQAISASRLGEHPPHRPCTASIGVAFLANCILLIRRGLHLRDIACAGFLRTRQSFRKSCARSSTQASGSDLTLGTLV